MLFCSDLNIVKVENPLRDEFINALQPGLFLNVSARDVVTLKVAMQSFWMEEWATAMRHLRQVTAFADAGRP